jgi:hypothetical protein
MKFVHANLLMRVGTICSSRLDSISSFALFIIAEREEHLVNVSVLVYLFKNLLVKYTRAANPNYYSCAFLASLLLFQPIFSLSSKHESSLKCLKAWLAFPF